MVVERHFPSKGRSLNALTQRFLANRGLDGFEAYSVFDDGTHPLLGHVDEACLLMRQAWEAGVKVLVVPDFDCDGIMSGTVLVAGLSELGFDVDVMTQDTSLGYALTRDFADLAMSRHPTAQLVITCDRGINDEGIEEFVRCKRHVIVTDHHVEDGDRVPADVIVDPCAIDSTYPNRSICGAHVAWQLLDRYAHLYCNRQAVAQMSRLRLFAACGTMSDGMLLVHENRQLVRDGVGMLRYLASEGASPYTGLSKAYSAAFAGMSALMREIAGNHRGLSIDEQTFSFYVAPTLNTIKRLKRSTSEAYDLLFGDDQAETASRLVYANDERRRLVRTTEHDVLSADQPYAPIAYISPKAGIGGIAGLVATDLMGASGRPTLVLERSGDSYHGSGRSPDEVDARSIVITAGGDAAGHEQAFGCTIPVGAIGDVVAALGRASAGIRRPDPFANVDAFVGRDVDYDEGLLRDFVDDLETMRPFGHGFEGARIAVRIRSGWPVSTLSNGRHLKCQTPFGIDAIAWNQGGLADAIADNGGAIVGSIGINRWNGHESVQVTGDAVANGA